MHPDVDDRALGVPVEEAGDTPQLVGQRVDDLEARFLDPAECLVVEDAPSGLRAAKAAGCATLALTSTTNVTDLDATTDADTIIDSLAAARFSVTTAGVTITAP